MASNNIELGRWGDGEIRLVYWDRYHGDDRVFILGEDGQAFVEGYTDHECDDGAVIVSELVRKPINLVQALVELYSEIEQAVEKFDV